MQGPLVDAKLPHVQAEVFLFVHEHHDHDRRGECIGGNGGGGDSRGAQVKNRYGEYVEHGVRHRGDGERVERTARVALCAQDRRAKIEHEEKRDAGEVDSQVAN